MGTRRYVVLDPSGVEDFKKVLFQALEGTESLRFVATPKNASNGKDVSILDTRFFVLAIDAYYPSSGKSLILSQDESTLEMVSITIENDEIVVEVMNA